MNGTQRESRSFSPITPRRNGSSIRADFTPQHDLARTQMDGFGGIVSVELEATAAETRAVPEELEVFTLAVSLGGTESLVDHPATMSASYLSDAEREAAGISESLVRLPVGIEV